MNKLLKHRFLFCSENIPNKGVIAHAIPGDFESLITTTYCTVRHHRYDTLGYCVIMLYSTVPQYAGQYSVYASLVLLLRQTVACSRGSLASTDVHYVLWF